MPGYDNTDRCGLFRKESQKGTVYFSGVINITEPGEHYINLFKNEPKTDKHPPYTVTTKLKQGGSNGSKDSGTWNTDQ